MKVALVSPQDVRVVGGVESYVVSLARALRARGHEVVVHCPRAKAEDGLRSLPAEDWAGVRLHRDYLRAGEFGHFFPGLLVSLLKERPNAVHAHSFRHPHTVLALLASRMLGVPCVLTSHSSLRAGEGGANLGGGKRLFDRTAGRATTPAFDAIVCVDPSEEAFFKQAGADPAKVRHIGGGYSGEAPENGTGDEHQRGRILVVCRLAKLAGSATLRELVERNPELTFEIIGPGRAGDMGRNAPIAKASNVEMRGFVAKSELEMAYLRADVLLHPVDRDAFPLAVVDGLAHGLPVVASAEIGLARALSSSAIAAVAPGDVAVWDAALKRLVGPSREADRLREAAKDAVRGLSWERVAEEYDSLYRHASHAGGTAS